MLFENYGLANSKPVKIGQTIFVLFFDLVAQCFYILSLSYACI